MKFILFTLDGYVKKVAGSEQEKCLIQDTIDLFTAVISCVCCSRFL